MKKILKIDSTYRLIDGEGIEIQDTLPKGIYELKCGKRSGFWLEKLEMEAFPNKVYGGQDRIMNKVLRKYEATSGRNLGVLVSGSKGTGKSLFVRNLAVHLSNNIPVIIIKTNYGSDMLSTLASIQGKCVLVFDEFEKMFRADGTDSSSATKENDIREQETALSFFDGVETKQEKLILLTVNNTYLMSKYLLGRPGRIYYHFIMTPPTQEEIMEYLKDNISSKEYSTSSSMDLMASTLSARAVSWDSLSAFVAEINSGESIEDTIRDLNIRTDSDYNICIDATVTWDDGEYQTTDICCTAATQEVKFTINRNIPKSKYKVDAMWTTVKFNASDLVPEKHGKFSAKKFTIISNEDADDNEIENAPKIVNISVGRHYDVTRAAGLNYGSIQYMM